METKQISLPEKTQSVQPVWGNTEDVMTMVGFKRTKLNALRKADLTFPKPIMLSENHLRWNLDEIRQWIAAQEAKRA